MNDQDYRNEYVSVEEVALIEIRARRQTDCPETAQRGAWVRASFRIGQLRKSTPCLLSSQGDGRIVVCKNDAGNGLDGIEKREGRYVYDVENVC